MCPPGQGLLFEASQPQGVFMCALATYSTFNHPLVTLVADKPLPLGPKSIDGQSLTLSRR
jgi:hypothetical protein